jgi:hypothetical protein
MSKTTRTREHKADVDPLSGCRNTVDEKIDALIDVKLCERM